MNLTEIKINAVTLSEDKKSIQVDMPLQADKVVQVSFGGLRDINNRSVSVDKVYYTLNQLIE